MTASILGIFLWIGWAMGTFAFLSPGLARADQQQKVLDELHAQKVERVESAILAAQRDYCTSADDKPKQFYLERRNMKLNEYFALTERQYQGLPSCEEL